MTPRSVRQVLLAAAFYTAAFGGTAFAKTKAKPQPQPQTPPLAQAQANKADDAKVRAPLCDVLADDPEDQFALTRGVDMHSVDAAKAVPACQAAVAAAPEEGRLRYALGRALQRSGDQAGALDAYQRAAERGYPIAENLVGLMYQNARQVETAAQWIERAASHGYLPAQTIIATFYLQGVGVPKDSAKGVEWLRKAAGQNYPMAETSLSALYLKGDAGVTKDEAQAYQWAKKAADQNYGPAQMLMGEIYLNGSGAAKKDEKAAFAWYLKAADQGIPPAEAQVGAMYHAGVGVARDDAKAVDWLQKAVDYPFPAAQPLLDEARTSLSAAKPPEAKTSTTKR